MATELARISADLKTTMESLLGTIDDLARELVRVLGVNQTDRRALELIILAREKSMTPGLLAERLGLTAAGTTIVLNRLERMGYVSRSLHPTDRRRVIVVATDLAALRIAELLFPLLDRGAKMLESDYDATEVAFIVTFLNRTIELQKQHLGHLRALRPYPH
ncbi:MAG: MarR family transcriptional regulator [Mycolicibacterium sp.]|nr:MarR family transcriptional regulator [Mycolicibacterium sp.]